MKSKQSPFSPKASAINLNRTDPMPFRQISRRCSLFLLFTVVSCSSMNAGEIISDTGRVDSVKAVDTLVTRSAARISGVTARARKRPWVAVGLSAVLPGAGQIYNETYWKPPVIWGLMGYWIYEWRQNNTKYWDYRSQYAQSVGPEIPGGNRQLLNLRDHYRDQRDAFAWYLGAIYFLNLVDAYVSANLFDFDVGPDLTVAGRGYPSVNATIRVRF